MSDERTELPEGTEVELQLVKVADAFADAPRDCVLPWAKEVAGTTQRALRRVG